METEYHHNDERDCIDKHIYTSSGVNDPAISHNYSAARHLSVSLADGQLSNDDTDTETVAVSVVDGLEVARGTDPSDASVLDYDGDVTFSVDGQQTTKTLTNGSVEFELTTDKSAGSEIEIVAESLVDHPAVPDSAVIEVVEG